MVFDFAGSPKPMKQMTESDRPLVMGTPAEVRKKIDNGLPGVDWSDPTWGVYFGDGFSLEFSMCDEPELNRFVVHVRGGGDAIGALLQVAVPNRWSLLDGSTGEWIDPKNPSQAGWLGFQAFRDQALGPRGQENGE
jgi:hypothetical protein